MATDWKRKISYSIELLTIGIISILLFEYVIHPVLVDIDPMFSWQHGAGEIGGRAPDSPAGAALMVTGMIIMTTYTIMKIKIN